MTSPSEEIIHKDFFGQLLSKGDKVACMRKNYRGLLLGEIYAVTPQQIRIKYMNTWNYGKPGREETYIVYPQDVVKKPNENTRNLVFLDCTCGVDNR